MTRAFVLSLAAAVFGLSSFGAAGPELVPVPVAKSYIPLGFDDNDVTQVVVAGHFPDTCHKLGPTNVRVESGVVWIEQTAYQYSDICLRMFVPFAQPVSVGILRAGTYTIVDATSKQPLGGLPILVSKNPGPDDFLYAPVTDADVVASSKPGHRRLVIRGNFTNRCTKLKEVRVEYQGDILVVLPIAEYTAARNCGYEKLRFDYSQDLEVPLKGTYLLHVRSMGGQAVNKILDLE